MSINSFTLACSYWFGTGLVVAAAGYACVALYASIKSRRIAAWSAGLGGAGSVQATSVLKPLRGHEPRLYENLRGFCLQTHPDYQLVFGVCEAADPAINVVQRLRAEFPRLAISLVIDSRVHGSNLKVGNLINMLPHAKHDWLVLADSDISVPTDYLTRVTAPLAEPEVGVVTCLYHGVAGREFWSRLGRLFIDDWFAPSVRLAHACGSTRFGFGSTIALRREKLEAIGGFEALRNTLADDFWLGELTRQRQWHTVLSEVEVGTQISETRLPALWAHELRWLRTIRALAPRGFALTFVSFTSPLLLLGLCLAPNRINTGLALLGGTARILLHFSGRRVPRTARPRHDVLLIPLRDALLLLEWAVALTSWRVTWRGRVLHARDDGRAPPV